jgi:hypothetical protein
MKIFDELEKVYKANRIERLFDGHPVIALVVFETAYEKYEFDYLLYQNQKSKYESRQKIKEDFIVMPVMVNKQVRGIRWGQYRPNAVVFVNDARQYARATWLDFELTSALAQYASGYHLIRTDDDEQE